MLLSCNLQALRRSLSDSLLREEDDVSVEGLEYTDLHFHEGTVT